MSVRSPGTPSPPSAPQPQAPPPRPGGPGASGGRGAPGGPGGPGAPLGCSWWLLIPAIILINYLLVTMLLPSAGRPVEVSYTLFRQQVEAGNVTTIATRGDIVQGVFKKAVVVTPDLPEDVDGTEKPQPETVTDFSTTLPSFASPDLENLLIENGVVINAQTLQSPPNPLITLLLSFGPALLMIGLIVWMGRRFAGGIGGGLGGGIGGAFGLGQSRAKRYDVANANDKVTFDDVAGIDEAKNELAETVDFLKNPGKYTRLGGAAPKGVLLIGQPGTGKTLLARAVAGEAGVPFFSMTASEFVEMVVGVGASRVRDLFDQARKAAPSIIFIDELDAIGRKRGKDIFGGGSSEQEQTLNQILTEMDGFAPDSGVIVLAATNMPEVLDPALLRPGRFDRRVTVQPPDKLGRAQILKVHTRKVPLAPDVDLDAVAGMTPGLVGADLRNLVNEAAILAAHQGQDAVTQKNFVDALEKIVLGPERKLLLKQADRRRVAYHEAGHAVLGLVVPGADPVSRVTITPRGQSLGVTYQRPEDDRYNYSESYLRGRIIGALGGRAAEELEYGDRTSGAESDLQQVTRIAMGMVTRWGMTDTVGPIALAPEGGQFLGGSERAVSQAFSQATAEAVDRAARQIIDECYARALALLKENRAALDGLANALLEHESLDEQQVLAATGLPPRNPTPPGGTPS